MKFTKKETKALIDLLELAKFDYESAIFEQLVINGKLREFKGALNYKGLCHGLCYYIITNSELRFKIRIIRYISDNYTTPLKTFYYKTPDSCKSVNDTIKALQKRIELINKIISSLKNQ